MRGDAGEAQIIHVRLDDGICAGAEDGEFGAVAS